uniref:Uncharacterized protein n=1 Tax=Arundo donax TaxID=35708 RepID=A0A0A9GN18_ARUDO
MARRSRGRR